MSLVISVWLLLASCLGQTSGMALSVWQQPEHNGRRSAGDPIPSGNIRVMVIQTMFKTIYQEGDPRRMRTAGFGFNFQIEAGLWALCPTTAAKKSDCMVGSCFDNLVCSTGCGFIDRTTVSAITCTESGKEFCSTAYLTQSKGMEPVVHYACADDVDESHYMGFTTDSLPEDFLTSNSISTTQLSSSSATSTSPTPPITAAPSQSNIASEAESGTGGSQPDSQSSSGDSTDDSGANSNIGPIVGGAIGGLALVCGSGLAIVWLLRKNKNAEAKSTVSSAANETPYLSKPELEAYQRERAQLFGQGLSEMSARTPAAYDTASYRPQYPPMTPVEMADTSAWKVR